MRAFRLRVLSAATALLVLGFAGPVLAVDFYVYKATVKIVAQQVFFNPNGNDIIVTRKIGNKEFINLALGRPLDTKIDSATEVLAGAGTYANEAAASKLIIFDPSQNGLAQIKAVVGTIDSIDFTNAYLSSKSQGVGFGTASIAATTLGDPTKNGFLPFTLNCDGQGAGSHDPFGGNAKVSGKGNGQGRLRFVFTDASNVTQTFDGIIVKAQGKGGGKPIGGFTQ
jgi:hypothetical protein